MKKIYTIFFAFLFLQSNAQNKREIKKEKKSIDKAEQILEKLALQWQKQKNILIDFEYIFEQKQNSVKEVQKGKIKIKENKYHLQLPIQEVYADGKTLWSYSPEINEVQITQPANDEDALTPINLLKVYERGFVAKLIKTEKQPQDIYTIQLLPEDPQKKSYHSIMLSINKNLWKIKSIKIKQKDGSLISYELKKIQTDINFSNQEFIFDEKKYPGVEINDLR